MNIQERTERFNETVRLLNEQGARAYDVGKNLCQYKTTDGLKCAVGLWIPEGHPGQSHVGSYVRLIQSHPDLRETLGVTSNKDAVLYEELQSLHDHTSNWEDGQLDPIAVEEIAFRLHDLGVIE